MIELPQSRRQSQPRFQGLSHQCSETLPALARLAEVGWSPADELAALETVWESLCQDAASPALSLQLPNFPSTSLNCASAQRPPRQRDRLADTPGRLAS